MIVSFPSVAVSVYSSLLTTTVPFITFTTGSASVPDTIISALARLNLSIPQI